MNEEDLNDLFGGASPFSDFFETYFGGGATNTTRGRTRRAGGAQREAYAPAGRSSEAEAEIDVTLAEAYQGATRVFELTEPDGSTRRLEVKIPAGVDEGTRIRLPGDAGRGDIYLRVHILPDPRFTRQGSTLRTRVDVPLATAVLGGEVHVPTPGGRQLLLRIPAGTTNGRTFRLSGQGMPTLGHPERRGDLYAEVNVVLPTHLNAEQRRLFEAFARSIGYSDQEAKEGASSSHG